MCSRMIRNVRNIIRTATYSMPIDIQRAEVLLPTDRRGITTKTNVNRTNKPSTTTGHLHFPKIGEPSRSAPARARWGGLRTRVAALPETPGPRAGAGGL